MCTKGRIKKREGKISERTPGLIGTGKFGWGSGGKMHKNRKRLMKTFSKEN